MVLWWSRFFAFRGQLVQHVVPRFSTPVHDDDYDDDARLEITWSVKELHKMHERCWKIWQFALGPWFKTFPCISCVKQIQSNHDDSKKKTPQDWIAGLKTWGPGILVVDSNGVEVSSCQHSGVEVGADFGVKTLGPWVKIFPCVSCISCVKQI